MKPEEYQVRKGCVFVGLHKQYAAGETLDADEKLGNVQRQIEVLEPVKKTKKAKEE